MHILHVYKDYWPVIGGIENHVRVLAEAQAAAGHDVTVLATAPGRRGQRETLGGVTVIRAARLATVASTPISPALALTLRGMRPELTHLHLPYPVGEAAWLAFGRHPMVATYHSDVVRQRQLLRLWAPWLRRVLARADRVLATSPPYVESSPFLSAVRNRVTVVPLGVDATRFTADRTAARARYAPDDAPTLVFVGRLRYYKGLGVLLDALPQLPRARLLVVGDGPMAQTWRAKADARGVAGRVRWLGRVTDDELPRVLAASDVFVYPAVARSEAYGLALVEAMAAGLPAVSTELGTGTSWVNRDGVTGHVVPPGDPAALGAAVEDLLDDPQRRAQMGRAARQRVRNELTQDTMIARVAQVYRSVCGGTPALEPEGEPA